MILPRPMQADRDGPSDWDWAFAKEIFPDLLEGIWVTIQLALLGICIAMVLGLALAILRRSKYRVVRYPVAVIIEFIRGTPLLVQLFFLFYVMPNYGLTMSGFTTAVVGLGVHYACYTSETYRAGIESVPAGQWEAATAVNLSRRQTWTSVVLPQGIPTVIPALGNYLVASFKDAPLAANITVIEVLGAAQKIQGQTFRGLEAFTIAGLLFLAVSIPASLLIRQLERRHAYERT